MARGRGILAAGVALTLAGCGGSVPGLRSFSGSLTEGGVYGSVRARPPQERQTAARSPWDVAALRRQVPAPQFTAERTERMGSEAIRVRELTFAIEPVAGTVLSVSGALAAPVRTTGGRHRLPALVRVSDAEPEASADSPVAWAARGYMVLELDLPGKGREKGRSSGPDWAPESLTSLSPAANPLHAAVAAVIAAVSLLAAQPEVDARRIGLVGEGWGGVAAALAGAVDDRARALVLVRAAGGLERGPLAEALERLTPTDREAWKKAYDPDSYAKVGHPATLFVQPAPALRSGAPASEPPLTALITTFRGRAGARALALIPPEASEREIATEAAWLASRLLGEAPLPEIRSVRAEGDSVIVTIEGKLPVRSVVVYSATGDLSKAEWKSTAADRIASDRWRCGLPSFEGGEPLTVLAAVTDSRGAVVCSEPGPPLPDKAAPREAVAVPSGGRTAGG